MKGVVNSIAYAGGLRLGEVPIPDISEVLNNDAMKRLAGWAAIIAVPTMIAGVYGMNFKFMPELEWFLGYPVTMAVMLGACGYLYYRFKRSGWL